MGPTANTAMTVPGPGRRPSAQPAKANRNGSTMAAMPISSPDTSASPVGSTSNGATPTSARIMEATPAAMRTSPITRVAVRRGTGGSAVAARVMGLTATGIHPVATSGNQMLDLGHRGSQVGQLALDRPGWREEEEHDARHRLAGGASQREGVGGPLEPVARHAAVQLFGVG